MVIMQIKKFSVITSTITAAFLLAGCGPTMPPVNDALPSTATSPSASLSTPEPTTDHPAPASPSEAPQSTPSAPSTVPGTALAALETLPVKGAAPKTGYDRAQFGKAWADVDGNGCDTRNDILARDMTNIVKDGKCKVKSGTLADPYTGQSINFRVGPGDLVDIDHIVALSDSWITGSQGLSADQRLHLANDPLNLMSADAAANRQKGDKNAASWLPANKAFRCAYVARQVAVKQKYGLWVQPAEKEAIARVLSACPDEPLPVDGASFKTAPDAGAPSPAPAVVQSESSSSPAVGENGNDPQFSSCKQAKAAGYGPYQKGEPEYEWYRDGDGDGITCE